ncbi:hypothetical protein BDR26DRAFT_858610 [Obelidium mucronatum]|nr:hypothetical protein BDR26DRAFT_858610 [Obelidium mucronatum]
MADTDFSPSIPRWLAFFFTLIASPLLSCIPYACQCFSRDSRLFKAYYLQGIGMGAIAQAVLIVSIIFGAGDACSTLCSLQKAAMQDSKGSFKPIYLQDCNGSCKKGYPAGIGIAVILGVFGGVLLFVSRIQILKAKRG